MIQTIDEALAFHVSLICLQVSASWHASRKSSQDSNMRVRISGGIETMGDIVLVMGRSNARGSRGNGLMEIHHELWDGVFSRCLYVRR